MTLAPLLHSTLAVRLHAFPALAAILLGAAQLALPKGTPLHRAMGWTWVVLMALIAGSSFFIHTICSFGPYSLIHLLSVLTLVSLPLGVYHARSHHIAAHARVMKLLFLGALVIAGLFTLLPGRIMHDVVFGTVSTHGACG